MLKKQQGFSKVVIFIIVLVVIAGGVLTWQFWPESVVEQEPIVEQNSSFTEEPPTIDEIANWQTYRNEEYGFEVKYPNNWPTPRESASPGLGIRYEHIFSFMNEFNPPADKKNKGFAIGVYKISPEALEDGKIDGDELVGIVDQLSNKSTTIFLGCPGFRDVFIGQNNYPAIETYILSDNICYRETYFFSVRRGGYIYNIVPQPEGGNAYAGYDGKVKIEESMPEFTRILSMFKFLE